MFRLGNFRSHSGLDLSFKIECDDLTYSDIEAVASVLGTIGFREVIGVPRGGLRLAAAMGPYKDTRSDRTLIVDDVLTTGTSMEEVRTKTEGPVIGAVIFARGPVPGWIIPMFTLWVPFNAV